MRSYLVIFLVCFNGCMGGSLPQPPQQVDPSLYRIDDEQRVIYGKTPDAIHDLCMMRVGAFHGKKRMKWYDACHDPKDDVIVVPEGVHDDRSNKYLWDHEMKHRLEGDWHD